MLEGFVVLTATAATVAMVAAGSRAQSQSAVVTRDPAFEVASVKPNKTPPGPRLLQVQRGGRFTATNVPLRELILLAYGVQSAQLDGGPPWIRTERFDIAATATSDPPPSFVGGPPSLTLAMLRGLLTERFKLVVHNEKRDLPTNSLVIAREDGRLGPKLRRSMVDCAAVMAAARDQTWATPPSAAAVAEGPKCDVVVGFGHLAGGGVELARLAIGLSPSVGRIVLDRTGLSGIFDFDLTWTPDRLPPRSPEAAAANLPVRVNGFDIDPNGPSLLTALQEQLGLKLESSRGLVDVIVIDHVEPPTPD
jgi:uncharacterized protein (TIGR03435 family)